MKTDKPAPAPARRERGRPPVIDWKKYDRWLGKLDDRALARMIGCTSTACLKRRRTLGIAAVIPEMWGRSPVPRILPALDAGEVVVLDRFWWSTLVYGIVGGASVDSLNAMIEVELKAWRGVRPAIGFVIDRSAPFSLRTDERMSDWQRLREEYRSLAERQSREHRVVRITNEDSAESATNTAAAAASHTDVSSSTVGA